MTTVSNNAELMSALSMAVGGETLELAPGNYGKLNIRLMFSSDVTIISADPDNPAIVTDLYVRDASHLVFDGILFSYDFAGEVREHRPFEVLYSSNITIRNSVFDGAFGVGGLYGNGIGLQIGYSNNITVEYNEFFRWWKALGCGSTTNLVVSHNNTHSVDNDAFNFVTIDGALIEGNWFHDFLSEPGTGHRDMIQFFTVINAIPSKNITIRGNFFDGGLGTQSQTIFMRNGVVDTGQGSFEEYAFRNILIENNVIYNGQVHGITVGETVGLVVRNNTILFDSYLSDGVLDAPQMRLKLESIDVTVLDNISHWEVQISPGWTFGHNLVVQSSDPDGENYYADLFFNALVSNPGLADLRALLGGLIETEAYGAEMTRSDIPLLAGPYATAGTTPPPELGVCEALLVEALAAAADLETQLAASQSALAAMTDERDIANADGEATLVLLTAMTIQRDLAVASLLDADAALLAMTAERDAALLGKAAALSDLAVASAKLAAIQVIVEG